MGLTHVPAGQVGLQHPEIPGNVVVEGEDFVPRAEAHLDGELVGIDLVPLVGDVALTPYGHYDAECHYGEDEVVEHAARHYQQALPGVVGAEFPGLRLALHLGQVHALVYHSGYLAISSERKPAYAVLGLPLQGLGAEPGEPFAAFGAEEESPSGIEEEKELLDPDGEQFRKGKVPGFVHYNQYGQRKEYLQ